ncbi:prefoldin, beta subunit, archaeal [Caldisphaera lagunensis DSM 15908]|uniref:Prefoldin subunit beta n=1 Tax=Caldisphaera lagunensis (strain DSM 15908 / JCM 11604 / ANMR 0165 / IC-154) TaxID=1056495 RepID=L0AB66_CALLD|nr:prefoldin subunit beta [Caldisphaera lagunensis]AFZ71133.1 prefoldin, beta subunit, archaeal [Caldisphaera lagunensis DSM 15908]
MVERVPPEAEAKYNKYLQLRDSYNVVVQERINAESSLGEIEKVLEKLQSLGPDAELYKMTGFVLVKSRKEDLQKELETRKEDLELKIKALKNQETMIKEQIDKITIELRQLLSGIGGTQTKTGIGGAGS